MKQNFLLVFCMCTLVSSVSPHASENGKDDRIREIDAVLTDICVEKDIFLINNAKKDVKKLSTLVSRLTDLLEKINDELIKQTLKKNKKRIATSQEE